MIFNSGRDVMMTSFITKKELESSAILNLGSWIKCVPFYLKLVYMEVFLTGVLI